jgi:hypothetical protein
MLIKCVHYVLDIHRVCGTDIFDPDPSFYTVVPGADHLVPRGQTGGAVPQLSRMSSWYEAFTLCIVYI